MRANRHRRDEVLVRRQEVSSRYLAGERLYEIAKAVDVTPAQVSSDLKVLRKTWRTNCLENIGEATRAEVARLDQVEAEAWSAWERSVGLHHVTRTEIDSEGKKRLVTTTRKLAGAPRYLEVIGNCVERRSKLLGLYPAPKLEVGGKITIELLRQIIDEAEEADKAAGLEAGEEGKGTVQ